MAPRPRTRYLYALLVAASVAARPALAERKPVAVGLLGGITSTSYYGDDVNAFDFEIWPTTGFTLAFHLPAFLGLEVDCLYAGKSGSLRQSVLDTVTNEKRNLVTTIKLHALEIPFLVKITAPTESEVQPIFFGGPSLDWFISRKTFSEFIDFSSGIVGADEQEPIIPLENMVAYEWTLCVGAGVEWGLGSFQIRANISPNSLDKTGEVDLRTVNLAVMAGFIF